MIRLINLQRAPLYFKILTIVDYEDANEFKETVYDEQGNEHELTYSLRAIVNHHGDYSGGGHYTAYCKRLSQTTNQDVWAHFDDENVTLIQDDRDIARAKKCGQKDSREIKAEELRSKNSDGVMMVYVMKEAVRLDKTYEENLFNEVPGRLHTSYFYDQSGKNAKQDLEAILVPRREWFKTQPTKKNLHTEVAKPLFYKKRRKALDAAFGKLAFEEKKDQITHKLIKEEKFGELLDKVNDFQAKENKKVPISPFDMKGTGEEVDVLKVEALKRFVKNINVDLDEDELAEVGITIEALDKAMIELD